MMKLALGLFAAALAASPLHAENHTPAEIGHRHMAAIAVADVDALVADYADDAVILQEGKAVQGKDAIRAMFAEAMPTPGADAAPAIKATRIWEEGDVSFITWEMGNMSGTDQFLVRDGKIELQAVYMNGAPATAAE